MRHSGRGGSGGGVACPLCNRVFHHKSHFIGHYTTHTGEKPHACPYCVYRTARNRNMKAHIARIHPESINTFDRLDRYGQNSLG